MPAVSLLPPHIHFRCSLYLEYSSPPPHNNQLLRYPPRFYLNPFWNEAFPSSPVRINFSPRCSANTLFTPTGPKLNQPPSLSLSLSLSLSPFSSSARPWAETMLYVSYVPSSSINLLSQVLRKLPRVQKRYQGYIKPAFEEHIIQKEK